MYVHGIKLSDSWKRGEVDGYNLSERLQEGEAGGTAQLNYNNKLPIDAGPLLKIEAALDWILLCVCVCP